MLKETEILEIKRLYNCERMSLSAIARRLGYSFATVKKYALHYSGDSGPTIRNRSSRVSKYDEDIKGFIKYNQSPKSGKQKLTMKRMFGLLQEKHGNLNFSLRAFQRYLGKGFKYRKDVAFVPQLHLAGSAQIDFGTNYATVGGQLVQIRHLVLNFPHSGRNLSVVLPGENQQCLFWGLNRIFRHVGGIPHTIRIDNASSMVDRGKEYKLNELFEKYATYYGFKVERCSPAAGNQKGCVERGVATIRQNFLSPIPEFEDFGDFNDKLLDRCDKLMDGLRYGSSQLKTVLWGDDKAALLPMPEVMFEPVRWEERTTDKAGIISISNRAYTTAGNLCNQRVHVKLGAFTVEIYDKRKKLVVVHERCYFRGSAANLEKYEASFVRAPQALYGSGLSSKREADKIAALPKDDRLPAVRELLERKFGKRSIKTYAVKNGHYGKAFEVAV